ncbi:MAG: rod shape-determining protein, partial [Christensenellaceae bacterium]
MNKIAIDLGSAVTKIFKIGSGGIVLVEPSCVAINTTDSSVKAIGAEAKALLGKTGDFTQVCFPISEGLIVNVKQASTMLNHFLCQIDVKGAEAVFCVHCGFDKAAKDTYMELADLCALKKVSFVESPILSCLGDGVPFTDSEPAFCIDIGHETTDIAAFSSDGIIAGICMNIGGKQVDTKIV